MEIKVRCLVCEAELFRSPAGTTSAALADGVVCSECVYTDNADLQKRLAERQRDMRIVREWMAEYSQRHDVGWAISELSQRLIWEGQEVKIGDSEPATIKRAEVSPGAVAVTASLFERVAELEDTARNHAEALLELGEQAAELLARDGNQIRSGVLSSMTAMHTKIDGMRKRIHDWEQSTARRLDSLEQEFRAFGRSVRAVNEAPDCEWVEREIHASHQAAFDRIAIVERSIGNLKAASEAQRKRIHALEQHGSRAARDKRLENRVTELEGQRSEIKGEALKRIEQCEDNLSRLKGQIENAIKRGKLAPPVDTMKFGGDTNG